MIFVHACGRVCDVSRRIFELPSSLCLSVHFSSLKSVLSFADLPFKSLVCACVCVCLCVLKADEVTLCVSTRRLHRAESVKSLGCGNTRISSASVGKETLLRRHERILLTTVKSFCLVSSLVRPNGQVACAEFPQGRFYGSQISRGER